MVGLLMLQQYVRQTCDVVTCVLNWCKKDFERMIHPEVILCGLQDSKLRKLTNLVKHPIFPSKDEFCQLRSGRVVPEKREICQAVFESFLSIIQNHCLVTCDCIT